MVTTKKSTSYIFAFLLGGFLIIGVISIISSQLVFEDIKIIKLNNDQQVEKSDTAYYEVANRNNKQKIIKQNKNKVLINSLTLDLKQFLKKVKIDNTFLEDYKKINIHQARAPPI